MNATEERSQMNVWGRECLTCFTLSAARFSLSLVSLAFTFISIYSSAHSLSLCAGNWIRLLSVCFEDDLSDRVSLAERDDVLLCRSVSDQTCLTATLFQTQIRENIHLSCLFVASKRRHNVALKLQSMFYINNWIEEPTDNYHTTLQCPSTQQGVLASFKFWL